MRILVLGGTVFLSRAVAEAAIARGHDVVCAARGSSGSVPDGARLVVWDRADGAPPPAELTAGDPEAAGPFDAVVDVARHPSRVRAAVAAFPGAHWGFVSTVNVYVDDATPGQAPETGTLREPETRDVDLADPEAPEDAYGRMKVACEDLVRDGARRAFVVRPGLIVGPGDPTGRFTYWPERFADAATSAETDGADQRTEVLAPGDPDDVVQVIDVRDLAELIVTAAEQDLVGTVDGVGELQPIGRLLEDLRARLAPRATLRWVDSTRLQAAGVQQWSGDDAVPLWLPRPAYDGMLAHDPGPALAVGLRLRPVADTAADVVEWLQRTPDAARTGLSREREIEVLAPGG